MDRDEFARRTEAIRARLYRTAYLYLGSEADALEGGGRGRLSALRALKKLREPAFFETWLTRIVLNECRRSSAAGPGWRRRRPCRTPLAPSITMPCR